MPVSTALPRREMAFPAAAPGWINIRWSSVSLTQPRFLVAEVPAFLHVSEHEREWRPASFGLYLPFRSMP
ncbi:hypothetical protein DAT35_38175 [Vitiosangium sp. GDMCC 1.1324]|nr:hypothetical protein DAT35_38175 [Vitiosangium sp. GDMCC 1.1324]